MSTADISKCFARNTTAVAVRHIFDRHIKHNVKLIREALKSGGDPQDIPDHHITLGGGARVIKEPGGQMSPHIYSFHIAWFPFASSGSSGTSI